MTVRAARDDEGEGIHVLVDQMTRRYGWTLPACSWKKIAPFWYIAEVSGVIIGAVQVCIGWPVGRLELLAVRPDLSHTKKAKIVKALIYHAVAAMQLDGTQLVMTLIPSLDENFSRILERLGGRFAVKGSMVMFDLREVHDAI